MTTQVNGTNGEVITVQRDAAAGRVSIDSSILGLYAPQCDALRLVVEGSTLAGVAAEIGTGGNGSEEGFIQVNSMDDPTAVSLVLLNVDRVVLASASMTQADATALAVGLQWP